MPPELLPTPPHPATRAMRYDTTHILAQHDPHAVDFRAFYPYTPNEVKHRKRTTSAQLKVLESVFKRDTKPNATLRNELAQQLEMTARGVQVWFQNRRAKEKTKSTKAANPGGVKGPVSPAASAAPSSSSSGHPNGALKQEDAVSLATDDADLKPTLLKPVSPPQLHLITDVSSPTWEQSPVEPPPDSATFLSHSARAPLFTNLDPFNTRRGSLPVNAFPPSSDTALESPASVEWFDPLSRRRSVDASLQRLAANPYAQIARTKNSALFGPRFGVASTGRYANNRVPSRPALHHYSSVPHGVNIRRSSMDSRRLGLVLRTALSPPPASTPYINSRASLPDTNLYALSSRPLGSPIPGPLPSPNFSFGAASTPSMTSPSSADSERNSPDSLRSFSFPGADDHEDDGGLSPTYDNYSRFGSMVSIATSESSIASSYYPEIGGPALATDAARRNSCSPGQLFDFSELDSSAQFGLSENNPLGYQEDFGLSRPQGIVVPELASQKSYPSPTSTVSGQNDGLDSTATSVSVSSTVPISRSSELAFALQGQPEKSPTPQENAQPYLAFGTEQGVQHASGDLAPQGSELLYQNNSESDVSQGSFNASFPPLSEVYGSDNQLNQSLYQVYNDSLSGISPLDTGSNQNVEVFTGYS